ncbi:MAG: alpha-L-fucosidase, partial [Planctomycetaceae bacterium]|nr:alpha-L-fucosidase [Planctomycetaceae bacterium]
MNTLNTRRQFLLTTGATVAGAAVAPLLQQVAADEPSDILSDSLSELAQKDRARGIKLPKSDAHYQPVKTYVEDIPDADYVHASEAAHEAFRDIKFSIRIHWGVYSKWEINASTPYLSMSNEKKTEYNELYKTFNPVGFDAQEWMDFFKRSGIQAFAFTSKHCDGFSMFHTKTRV